MSLKRVLHIVGRMDRAGAETMIMNLYREIDRTKIQFDFVCFTHERCDYDDEIEALGGRIFRINSPNALMRFFNLVKILKKGAWEIVHAHTLYSSGLHLLAAKCSGVSKLVAHSHSTNYTKNTTIIGRTYKQGMSGLLSWVPTHYLACGEAAAEYLFPGRNDVQIIPNAIDINMFSNAQSSPIREELCLRSDTLVILQVGRFIPVKNHFYSVKIAASLKKQNLNFKMLFVGSGPGENEVADLVAKENLENHVLLLGLRADIPELMAAANVMIMPSLYEGFPVVLVESQAASLPAVIASTISHEVDLGLGLVDFIDLEESPELWGRKIQEAIKKGKLSADIHNEILEKKGFSIQAGVKRLMGIYS